MGNAKSAPRATDASRGAISRIASCLRARDACVVDGAAYVDELDDGRAVGRCDGGDARARERRDVGAVRVETAWIDGEEYVRCARATGGVGTAAQAPAEATMRRTRRETRAMWTFPRDAIVGDDDDDDDDDDACESSRVRMVISPAFHIAGARWRLLWRVDDASASLFARLERSRRDADVVARWSFAFLVGTELHHEVFMNAQRFRVGRARGVWNYIAGASMEGESSRIEGECVVQATLEEPDPEDVDVNVRMFERLSMLKYAQGHCAPYVRLISESPLLFVFENFVTDEEAEHLMAIAKSDLRRSRVTDGKLSEGRTSSGTFLTGARANDAVVMRIGDRIQRALRETPQIRKRQSRQKLVAVEPMQVVSYEKGECYTAHFDNRANCLRRAVTFMCYLHEPSRGGSTHFPKAKAMTKIDERSSTSVGVRIHPKRNRAIAFWNVNDGVEDGASLHEAEAVIEGNKQIFTQWLCVDETSST
jgi:prolyl 4-hydroxylase